MNTAKTLISLSFTLFLLMDSIGNVPIFLSLLKDIPAKRQYRIIFRELLIALGIILLFCIGGSSFLDLLEVQPYTVQMAGGLILFLIALKMIFPPAVKDNNHLSLTKEPFIVPLAIPLLAGPGVLASVMLYSHQGISFSLILIAVVLAWALSTLILMVSPQMQKILGIKGLVACERLMGLILTLLSIQMLLKGLGCFIKDCSSS